MSDSSLRHVDQWVSDSILDGYQQCTVHLGQDDEGEVTATLVRKNPDRLGFMLRMRRWHHATVRRMPLAILYVHGWNDYFYRRHASEFWESLGVAFYAIDLHKYGRSLHEGQTPGFTTDLHDYFAELDVLRDVIVKELGDAVHILVLGHSTGGLITSLWLSNEHPHHVSALALNSPWLELQGNRFARIMTTPVVKGFGISGPKTVVPIPDPGFYGRTLWADQGGEWTYQHAGDTHPAGEFVSRAGWLDAIYNGQAEVSRGLDIEVPVLVCTSDRTMIQSRWDEAMRESDTVLDVTAIRQNALNLGDMVSLAIIRHGIHDLSMSRSEARRRYFQIAAQWSACCAWGCAGDGSVKGHAFPQRVLEQSLDTVASPRGRV